MVPTRTRRTCLHGALAAGLGLALGRTATAAAAATRVVYPRHLDSIDDRFDYDWLILRTALERSAPAYGPFEMHQLDESMSPQRVKQELALPHGRINVFARGSSAELEREFLPVRLPIDKGLLGFRVFLVRAADLPRFAAVRSLADLRQFRAGQGKEWVDIPILRAAGIEVVEGSGYEALYSMLMAGRFDFFSRGVDEVLRELDEHRAQFPSMALEPTLMLQYFLPRYLFTRRDAEGEALARRIAAGLEIMLVDGTLNALFRQHKGPLIERLGLAQRRLLRLPGPALPPGTPLGRSELWYAPQNFR